MIEKKKEAPDVSVRYIVRITEKLMASNEQFADLVIDKNQTFRVHKKPFVCVSNGESPSLPIVVAEIVNPTTADGLLQYSAKDLRKIHKELIGLKEISYFVGRDKHGAGIYEKVDRRWTKLSVKERREIESTYFKKPVVTVKEPVLEEA